MKVKIAYLLFAPYSSSNFNKEDWELKITKNTPYFLDVDVDAESVFRGERTVNGVKVTLSYYLYDGEVFVAECVYEVEKGLVDSSVSLKEEINRGLRKEILDELGYKGSIVEEYSVVILEGLEEKPIGFVDKHKGLLARLMRSVDKEIGATETKEILSSRVSYSQNDLTIVDWEGALIISNEGYESDLDLLKVANYQLLRYRLLDSEIEQNLKQLREKLVTKKRKPWIRKDDILKGTIENQLRILLDYDKIDQSLLLVGDWYSAKIYRAIVEEFYIDDWKALVKEKMDSLVAIDDTVRQKLIFSWDRFFDMVSVVGWTVLLVGYFYLYFKDAGL